MLLDPVNGQLLFEKNAKERIYPASTTKILTAIIALESGKMRDLVSGEALIESGGQVLIPAASFYWLVVEM